MVSLYQSSHVVYFLFDKIKYTRKDNGLKMAMNIRASLMSKLYKGLILEFQYFSQIFYYSILFTKVKLVNKVPLPSFSKSKNNLHEQIHLCTVCLY